MKYKVLQPIKHNGDRHEPGAVVAIALKHAAPLVAAGVLAEVAVLAEVEAEVQKKPEPLTQAQIDENVAAAVLANESALAQGGSADANSEAASS